jgi:hypothetical protein
MNTPPTLARLRAANPALVREEDGRGPVAEAALTRILADHESGPEAARPSRRRTRRGLALVLAALVVGAGGAVAATDPFGWRSKNPDTAKFAVNPALRVRTPSAQQITCRPAPGGWRCRPGGAGQVYQRIDAIRGPARDLTRARFAAGISHNVADGAVTAAQAAKARADLASVPASFFTELEIASRYQTYGGGNGRVPPPGVPEFMVCEDAGRALACQDLNGDPSAPVGAGVYEATQARDWRPAPPQRRDPGLPVGISFTRAEYRLLIDLVKTAGSTHSSSGPRRLPRAPVRPSRRARARPLTLILRPPGEHYRDPHGRAGRAGSGALRALGGRDPLERLREPHLPG